MQLRWIVLLLKLKSDFKKLELDSKGEIFKNDIIKVLRRIRIVRANGDSKRDSF